MGFFRFGTNTPIQVLKVVKGVKQEKCKKCGKLVDANSLVDGLCEACRSTEPKQ